MNKYNHIITNLKSNEIFVFGSNLQGFHGAGSAGYASFGEHGNVWRKYNYDKFPDGSIWKWNIKGKNELQKGKEGWSYGLVTITKPGIKNSLTDEQRLIYIKKLYKCCNDIPDRIFYLAQTNKIGLNGADPKHLIKLYTSIPVPNNLLFHESFANLL